MNSNIPINLDLKALNPYRDYTGKPIILGSAKKMIKEKRIRWLKSGNAILTLTNGKSIKIIKKNQFNKTESTFNALLGNLTPGSQHEALFNREYAKYSKACLKSPSSTANFNYGDLFYYPIEEHLVWFAPRTLRILAWGARNELQFKNPSQTTTWNEQREIFGKLKIGIIGASVGSNILQRANDVLKPKHLKIADMDFYDDANRNRSRFGYRGLGRNKAQENAYQIHETDPEMQISVYSEGLHIANIKDFLLGDRKKNEPNLDYVVEVCDSPDIKIDIGQKCREYKIPLFRLTDYGTTWQVEYFPYDKDPHFPLSIDLSDEELISKKEAWEESPANRELFFDFAFGLVGNHWQTNPEFKAYIEETHTTPFSKGIPQTAIASESGASHIVSTIANLSLGYQISNRVYLDLRSNICISEKLFNKGKKYLLRKTTKNNYLKHEKIDVENHKILEFTECTISKTDAIVREYSSGTGQVKETRVKLRE